MSGVAGHIEQQESAEELHRLYRTKQDVGQRSRLRALQLVRSGRPKQEAAMVAGVGRRTLTHWLAWYRHGGLAEVLRRVPGHGARGAPRRLTPAQEAILARCTQGAFRTYGEAQRQVEREFGVPYRLAYRWRYLLLAFAPLTRTRRWAWLDRMRQADLIPVLQERAPTCLVWDGAPSHRDQHVVALPLQRVPLPAYAPELNPAQRLFEEIRARVEGVAYDTLEAKQAVAEAYLQDLRRESDRVKRLCGWAWLTDALHALSAHRA